MTYAYCGSFGSSKFWKMLNRKRHRDQKNRDFDLQDLQCFFSQLILGLDYSKSFEI